MRFIKYLTPVAAMVAATTLTLPIASAAVPLPGEGVTIQPGQDNVDGENFQTILVMKALEALGYNVLPVKNAKYPALHLSVANGDVTFIADHWNPLHEAFFEKAGGAEKLSRTGGYIQGCAQGYLIDKKTAQEHNITNIAQLKDPKIAKLFDQNGDGKADLTGCVPGWGCERVIEHHMDNYELRSTVTHNQGEYSAIIAETIARYKEGKPILYYTWTPYWVSGVLVPNKDVVWLEVPYTSHPNGLETELPNGKNYGFAVNTQMIVSNKAFVEKNPAAARLFEVMSISVNDVSAQNLKMREKGHSGWDAAQRHADAWIKANQDTFNGWIEEAKKAAAK